MPAHARALAAMSLFGGLVAAGSFKPVELPSIEKYGVQTVTDAYQVVNLPGCEYGTRTQSYSDHTVTTTVPAEGCPTGYDHVVGCGSNMVVGGPLVIVYRYDVVYEEVYEKTISCPYNEIGPYAFPGYDGSGLCEDCSSSQAGYVKECYNGNCAAYQCSWGSDLQHHCDDYTKPNGYVPAPAGCEIVTAHYPQCFDNYCFLAEAYYTVPIVIGFPPVYPPGFCHECLLPPGWTTIVTVLPGYSTSTTVTVPTTTVTTTTTATTTVSGSPAPTSEAIQCPEADRSVFVAASGTTFLIECNVGVSGTELQAREADARAMFRRAIGTTGTFNGCMQLCDDISECNAVSYNPETSVCRGFSDASVNANPNGDYVATVIRRANQASTTSTVSSTSTESSSSTDSATSTTDSTATSTTSTTSSATSASPSDDMDSAEAKRQELVPKRQAAKKAGTAGRVERRAGRIVSPNVEKEKKDTIRL